MYRSGLSVNNQLFVLGADDPEMREIENILKWLKCHYQYAMKDGKRVHPGNSYQADAIERLGEAWEVILIECQPTDIPNFNGEEIIRIDHHRPGDSGYDMPAKDFWNASSLGQLANFLGKEMELGSHSQLVLAAMDHCPAAAIRGECPGVSAEEVIQRKVEEIAKATGHSLEEVQISISYYARLIEIAHSIEIGGQAVKDMREDYVGEGYSMELLTSQVAALAGGYTVLLSHRDAPGKPEKWSISGHATPQCIEAFKNEWATAHGLAGIYGVPGRGYAGGYLSA